MSGVGEGPGDPRRCNQREELAPAREGRETSQEPTGDAGGPTTLHEVPLSPEATRSALCGRQLGITALCPQW